MGSYGTAEYDTKDFESRDADDKHVYVKFYFRPVEDEEKSRTEGRKCFKEVEYIEIRTPGSQTNVIQRPVKDMDRERFRRAYNMFKEGHEEQLIGTPLAECAWLNRSQVEELVHMRIRTLEHLSEVTDSVCQKMAGLLGLRERARKVLEAAKSQAPLLEAQRLNEEMKNRLEVMERTIADQSEIIKKLQNAAAAK